MSNRRFWVRFLHEEIREEDFTNHVKATIEKYVLYSSISQEVSTSENVEKVVSECNEKRQSINEFWNKTRIKFSGSIFAAEFKP